MSEQEENQAEEQEYEELEGPQHEGEEEEEQDDDVSDEVTDLLGGDLDSDGELDEDDEEGSAEDDEESLLGGDVEDEDEDEVEGVLDSDDDEVSVEAIAKELYKDFDDLSVDGKKDAIELVMREDQTWGEWFDSGSEVHGDSDRDLAILAARSGIGPEYLSEHGIYSLEDFKERLENERAKTSPKAWVLSDPDDPEQLHEFMEETLGIPTKREDYGDEWYSGTQYEEDQPSRESLLEHVANMRLSRGQAAYLADMMTSASDSLEKKEKAELKGYIAESKTYLEKVYKDHLPSVLESVNKALHDDPAGKRLLEEFGDSKFLNSPNLISLLHNALYGHKTSWKEGGEAETPRTEFSNLPPAKLRSMIKNLEGREHFKQRYARSMDPKIVERHEEIHILIDKLREELRNRT